MPNATLHWAAPEGLTVKDTTGHGIVSKDDLVVTGGTYTIDSQDHCLNGKDSVRIADGTFNLSCVRMVYMREMTTSRMDMYI